MGDGIQLNQDIVDQDAQVIADMSAYFAENPLCPSDDKTTISANSNGKSTYAASQRLIAAFGEAMDQEAVNIRELGLVFKEFDEMHAKLLEAGTRYPVIQAVE